MAQQVKDPVWSTAVAQVTAVAPVSFLAWEILDAMEAEEKKKKRREKEKVR